MRGSPIPALSQAEVGAFWSQTRAVNGCSEWTGQYNGPRGKTYGLFTIRRDGRRVRLMAHRVALTLATGVDGHFACHHCDNPPCVNPGHLYWGDAKTNSEDMVRRGRARPSMTGGLLLDPLRPLTGHSRFRRPDAAARMFRERVGETAVMPDDFDYAYWRLVDRATARAQVRAIAERVERGDGVDLGWSSAAPDIDLVALYEGKAP